MCCAPLLPELASRNLEDYEEVAMKLSRDPDSPEAFGKICRPTADCAVVRRNLEEACSTMVDIW